MRVLTPILVALLLTLLPVALGATTTQKITLQKGNVAYIADKNIRAQQIDVTNEKVRLSISGETVLFDNRTSDSISVNGLNITPAAFTKTSTGSQVSLVTRQAVHADITNANFPPKIHKTDAYQTYVDVRNTGATKTTFTVQLKGENLHVETSGPDSDPRYRTSLRTIASTANATVTLTPQEQKRLQFSLQPTEDSGEATATYSVKKNDETVDTEPFTVPITNEAVGYIQDIQVDEALRSGQPADVDVTVSNSRAVNSPYYLRLRSPDFRIDRPSRKLSLQTRNTRTVQYEVTPYGGGNLGLTATLTRDRQTIDTLHVRNDARGNAVYTIADIDTPSGVKNGEHYNITATLKNRGGEVSDVSMDFESDDFTVISGGNVIRLRPGQNETVTLVVETDTEHNRAVFTMKLVQQPQGLLDKGFNRRKTLSKRSETIKVLVDHTDGQTTENKRSPDSTNDTHTNTTTEATNDTRVTADETIPEPPNPVTRNTSDREQLWKEYEHYAQHWPYPVIAVLLLIVLYLALTRNSQ